MCRPHPHSTRPATLFPYATLFRSLGESSTPIPPRRLIVTVYGLYARERGGRLSVASLVRMLADLGIDDQAVRSAVSRLKRRGLLEPRSEEHTSELQSLMRISYAVFCLKKKKKHTYPNTNTCV